MDIGIALSRLTRQVWTCIFFSGMNSTEQWVRAIKSTLTPKAPDQRRSSANALSPMASLRDIGIRSSYKMVVVKLR